MLGMCQLGKQKGCTSLTDLNTETDQESSSREHCEILGSSLKGDRDQTVISKITKGGYMIIAPTMIPQRRPNLSAITGKMGIAHILPTG